MHRVISIALSMVFGSYGLVVLKSTVISFVNLILDSFNFRFAANKITPDDTRHEIFGEFIQVTSWLLVPFRKILSLVPHHS